MMTFSQVPPPPPAFYRRFYLKLPHEIKIRTTSSIQPQKVQLTYQFIEFLVTSFTALMNNRRLDAKHCDDNILLGTLALNSLDELKSRDASKFVVVAPSRRRSVSCALKPVLQTLHPTIGWECTTRAIKMLTCDAVTCFFLPFLTLPEL